VLGHPSFAFLLCSRVLANMGFHMLGVAVGWQLYALTGSALDLGLVGLAQFLPIVLLTLLVGQVADRCDRRLIAVVCQLVEAAAALALVAATVTGRQSNTTILAIVALIGAARAFESPATTALVSDVVPRPLIARAMAWLVSAWGPRWAGSCPRGAPKRPTSPRPRSSSWPACAPPSSGAAGDHARSSP